MRRTRLAWVGGTVGLGLLLSMGCSGPVLSVDDAVTMGPLQTPLSACLERPLGLGFRRGLQQFPIQFSAEDQPIGACDTQNRGTARTLCTLPEANCSKVEATAKVNGKTLEAFGTVFKWDPGRTVIAVDIDETISITDYRSLLLGTRDTGSRPIPGSLETMRALGRDYHVAYVTSRPRCLLDRTREWLREQGFPPGPVIVSANWSEWRHQAEFKRKALANLQRQWPNLLIGFGDRPVDMKAYTGDHMLTLIVNPRNPKDFGDNAVILSDWSAVARFFAANRDVLTRPATLAARITPQGKLRASPPEPVAQRAASGPQRPQAYRPPLPESHRRNTRG